MILDNLGRRQHEYRGGVGAGGIKKVVSDEPVGLPRAAEKVLLER